MNRFQKREEQAHRELTKPGKQLSEKEYFKRLFNLFVSELLVNQADITNDMEESTPADLPFLAILEELFDMALNDDETLIQLEKIGREVAEGKRDPFKSKIGN